MKLGASLGRSWAFTGRTIRRPHAEHIVPATRRHTRTWGCCTTQARASVALALCSALIDSCEDTCGLCRSQKRGEQVWPYCRIGDWVAATAVASATAHPAVDVLSSQFDAAGWRLHCSLGRGQDACFQLGSLQRLAHAACAEAKCVAWQR